MALDTLIQRIAEEAEKEKAEILARAESEAAAIISQAKAEGRQEAEKIRERGEKERARLREKILAAARREARMHITNAKEESIALCMEAIKDKMRALTGGEYQKIVEERIAQALDTTEGMYMIATRKEDRSIAQKLGIEVKGEREGIGGVILKSADGRMEIDLTFDFMLESERDTIRRMIARKLLEQT